MNPNTRTLTQAVQADLGSNEAPLLTPPIGPGWATGAQLVMGVPRGDSTPWWWQPSDATYKSAAFWNAIVPWFVIYPGAVHAAKNVRVKIWDLRLFTLQKDNTWKKIDVSRNPTWAGNNDFDLAYLSDAPARIEPDGISSYKLIDPFKPIHGGTYRMPIIGAAVAAVFASMKTQLILDNPSGTDDRGTSQLLASLGVDFYPTMTTSSDFPPTGYNPGAGMSRFGLIGKASRTHYFATIDPPGIQDNPQSIFMQGGGRAAIPVAQFESNSPPG